MAADLVDVPSVTVDPVVEPAVAADEKPSAVKGKKAKESKPKKTKAPAKRTKSVSSHPTYEEMIKDAIVSLKERTGSSQYAITKFIEEKQKTLPPNFKKLVLFHLKKLVAADKLVRVKSSFKLPPSKPARAAVATTKPVAKPAAKTKPAPAKAKSKAKPAKAKATAKSPAKSKAKVAVKPKAKAKAVAAPAKAKAIPAKAKAAAPRPKPKERPAKAARTSSRTTPGKKVASVAAKPAVKKAAAAKKTPVKSVKTKALKAVKSPAKKGPGRKAKK